MRLTLNLAAAALAAALAPPAYAQSFSTSPGAAQPGSYAVEPYHTRVLFAVSHLGFTTYYGDFSGASGTLNLSVSRPADSRVSVSVPVASVSTTNAKLDGELKSDAWLDAAKSPDLKFESTSITPTSATTATIQGNLTLHGVTKPLTLAAKFNAAGINALDHKFTVGFDAQGSLKRSDFGVTKYVPYIADEVRIIISAAFEKQG